MGNSQSNILERLDDIASDYILGADFNTMRKMKEKDYCNKVTIVTKDILEKQFSHMDIEYLATRANDGWAWETLFKSTSTNPKDNTVQYNATDSVGYIRKIENPNKPEMCLSISKFYVKIGHIFSAIVGTIKPRYRFSNGDTFSILTPKKELPPEGEKPFELSENGFCYKRIETLKFGSDKNPSSINPQFCNSNSKYNSANDIPGVPEFEMLYYDSTDENGNPMMSDRSLSTYRKDLTTFYKRFTDEETLPNEVHKFSDIQLKQYSSSERCMDNKYNQPIQPIGDSKENSLFEDYALNLREMIQVTGDLQQNLVEILNKIFTSKKKGDTLKITIQPKLTMTNVDKLIVETRNKLLELYLRCEEYFENGVNIYKAIVNERIINNTFEELITNDSYSEPSPSAEPEPEPEPIAETESNFGEEPYQEEEEEEPVFAEDDYLQDRPSPETPLEEEVNPVYQGEAEPQPPLPIQPEFQPQQPAMEPQPIMEPVIEPQPPIQPEFQPQPAIKPEQQPPLQPPPIQMPAPIEPIQQPLPPIIQQQQQQPAMPAPIEPIQRPLPPIQQVQPQPAMAPPQ